MSSSRHYTQVARAEQLDRTRRSLLDAAQEWFLAGRWGRVSLERLAGDAGVTKQTLLRHFGSKEGLLEQAVVAAFERVRAHRMSAPTHDIEGAVDNLLDHYEVDGEHALQLGAIGADRLLGDVAGRARAMHYEWVEHAFGAWLDPARGREYERRRAALIALCDVQTWWIFTHHLGLPRSEVRGTLIVAIRRLLEEDT